MNFIHFKNSLRDFPVFSIADIRAAYGGFDRRRLSEWQKKGYIQKIIKGYYLFSDVDMNENTLSAIANKIYKPSYISLETAMSHYRLIPEQLRSFKKNLLREYLQYKILEVIFESPLAEPFVYSKKEVNRILMFLDFVQQEI